MYFYTWHDMSQDPNNYFYILKIIMLKFGMTFFLFQVLASNVGCVVRIQILNVPIHLTTPQCPLQIVDRNQT